MVYQGFKAVEASAAASGARNPGAVAAAIGRKKYGKAAFQKHAAEGKSMRGVKPKKEEDGEEESPAEDKGENEATEAPAKPAKKAKPKGALAAKLAVAYGNPYQVNKVGSQFKVIGTDSGKVHGTFPSKDKAMKQFRLLEMIYHNKELKK